MKNRRHLLPVQIGVTNIDPPIPGTWGQADFPPVVTLLGRRFELAGFWQFPRSHVVAQYRQSVPRDSMHLMVAEDGSWRIDHLDDYNPSYGGLYGALMHGVHDVFLPLFATRRPVPPSSLLGLPTSSNG